MQMNEAVWDGLPISAVSGFFYVFVRYAVGFGFDSTDCVVFMRYVRVLVA